MPDNRLPQTLCKAERLCSLKRIEALFAGGNKSLSAFPLRVVYMPVERGAGEMPVQMLVSVSKRRFKHAVDRNRGKRLVREAYRRHKQILWDALGEDRALAIAFLWLSDEMAPYQVVEEKVVSLLTRIAESL